jgi:diguanylate cyclase (GGDEF)-like protein
MINGFLALNSSIVNRFTEQDSEYLQIFADQAAIAIYNAQMYGQAHELATTDTLTGLFNRHGLFQLGERELERAVRTERPLSVLMLDLDHFKKVNDTYGHPMGDRVLIALANCCRFHLRKVDIMARYGGEEFIFILPETNLERATQIAERLRASVQELSVAVVKENQNGQEEEDYIQITASLGVVRLNSASCSLSDLIARVDLALYDAKHTGRNRVAVVDYI